MFGGSTSFQAMVDGGYSIQERARVQHRNMINAGHHKALALCIDFRLVYCTTFNGPLHQKTRKTQTKTTLPTYTSHMSQMNGSMPYQSEKSKQCGTHVMSLEDRSRCVDFVTLSSHNNRPQWRQLNYIYILLYINLIQIYYTFTRTEHNQAKLSSKAKPLA